MITFRLARYLATIGVICALILSDHVNSVITVTKSSAEPILPPTTSHQINATTSGSTTRVSVASNGAQGNDRAALVVSISADGRYVAFDSYARNLGDTEVRGENIYVRDTLMGQTTLVSIASDGSPANDTSFRPAISADGRYVAFISLATNLVSNDTNNVADVFVHDQQTGQTTRVSVVSDGTQANGASGSRGLISISGDGRYVAFSSTANNLVNNDTNNREDAFLHDRNIGQTKRISVGMSGQGNNDSAPFSISADGQYVTLQSAASNLISGDNNYRWDDFVYDALSDSLILVSAAIGGTSTTAQGNSMLPLISANGRYVAFQSYATNLVSGGGTGIYNDIFIYDMQGHTNIRAVSQADFSGDFWLGGISSDGSVVFSARRPEEIASQVRVRDQANTITNVSVANDGALANFGGIVVGSPVSPDGRYVAFVSDATNLVSNDTNGFTDVFLRDRGVMPPQGSYSISGQITDHNGNPLPGAIVVADQHHATTTDNNGNYALLGFAAGTYVLTPSRGQAAFSSFAPITRTVILSAADATGQDFVARKNIVMLVHGIMTGDMIGFGDVCSATPLGPYDLQSGFTGGHGIAPTISLSRLTRSP